MMGKAPCAAIDRVGLTHQPWRRRIRDEAAEGGWEVGTVIWNPDGQLHLMLIDGVTGQFLRVVDRPFDYDSDPAP
jgi:hypothetical protein